MNLYHHNDKIIAPINAQQQGEVIEASREYIEKASVIYRRTFVMIPIHFDIKGRAAGMYRIRMNQREIRYNPYIFAKYFDDNLAITVPHEVAHYIMDMVYGLRKVRAHGPEWKSLMGIFGADAKATCSYDLSGIPLKSEQRFSYQCACRMHVFTSRRHKQAQKTTVSYRCRKCGDTLIANPTVVNAL